MELKGSICLREFLNAALQTSINAWVMHALLKLTGLPPNTYHSHLRAGNTWTMQLSR